MFVPLFFSPGLVLRYPRAVVSLPNKDYWLKEANKPALRGKLESLMSQIGIAGFLLMFLVEVLTIRANLAQTTQLEETFFWVVFIGFFVYVGCWLLQLHFSFRIPQDADRS